ncbi:MAG: ABC transporter permease [Phototrophicaceae bacterium]
MADATLNASKKQAGVAKIEEHDLIEPLTIRQIISRRFLRHRMAVFGLVMLVAVMLYVTAGAFFYTESQGNRTNLLNKGTPPSEAHPFGTDLVGRDVFIRSIYGGQISIAIALVSVAISISVGTAIGVISGYYGGLMDGLLSRVTEAFLAIPPLILLLVLSSVLTRNASTTVILGREVSATVVWIVLIIGLTSWMQLSRIVRAQVLSLKEQEFIVAARAMGVGPFGIIVRHLLPNLVAPIVVTATLAIGTAIITEAYLSFLGFGVQPPTATWGNMLTGAQDRIDSGMWWMWVTPGFFIVITVLAFNFIGDGVRDALDPRAINA